MSAKNFFILASASPRRKQLLTEAGYEFTVVIPNVDESKIQTDRLTPAQFACRAALAKASDVSEKFPQCLVIAADTVVDFDGQIIGKPRDAKDAEQIIRKLFSKPHKVITAIALVRKSTNLCLVDYDTTIVYPKKLTEAEVAEHIASGSWKDKAGAYAIQQGSDKFIERIDGSETNVVGLSMELFEKMIKKIGLYTK